MVVRERVWGGYLVHSSPLMQPPVPGLHVVQQMDRGGRGVTPQPFGEVSSSPRQPQQPVKKDSLMLLVAAPAPLLCSLTPSSQVRAQLWPRNGWQQATEEWWPGDTVPSPPAVGPAGVPKGFLCRSALRPFLWVAPTPAQPPPGDTGVKICCAWGVS